MTNSVYTLSTIKKEASTIDEPEYMDINADEAEAGSILMSLSQHTKRSEQSTTTNTMSIRNLLEDNDDRTTSHQEQSKINGQILADSSRSTIAHRYPEAVKEETQIPQPYANGMHGQHLTSTIPPPDASMIMGSTVQRQSESYDWQHQQRSSYNTHHHRYHQHEWYQQRPGYHHQQQYHQQQQQQQHIHQQQQQQQQQKQQTIKKPYIRYDPQQQHHQSTKKHSKIRRSALHVYISYMTYTDLKRVKSNTPHLQQPYGPQLMSKQNMHSPSTPMSKHPAAPASSSVQQQHHHHHHQPPLTAFLKDTIDSTVPTTPIPKSSLPPIEPHRPSSDWPDRHYHSSPPPPPHYRQPYPPSSFPTK